MTTKKVIPIASISSIARILPLDVRRTGVHASRTSRAPQLRANQAAVVRRAEAAAVSAIASGPQHNTIISIGHRIARSLSA